MKKHLAISIIVLFLCSLCMATELDKHPPSPQKSRQNPHNAYLEVPEFSHTTDKETHISPEISKSQKDVSQKDTPSVIKTTEKQKTKGNKDPINNKKEKKDIKKEVNKSTKVTNSATKSESKPSTLDTKNNEKDSVTNHTEKGKPISKSKEKEASINNKQVKEVPQKNNNSSVKEKDKKNILRSIVVTPSKQPKAKEEKQTNLNKKQLASKSQTTQKEYAPLSHKALNTESGLVKKRQIPVERKSTVIAKATNMVNKPPQVKKPRIIVNKEKTTKNIKYSSNTRNEEPVNSTSSYYISMGQNLVGKNYYQQAIECYQKAIRSNPRSATAFYLIGNAYTSMGKYYNAVDYYQKAIILNPKSSNSYYDIGVAYLFIGNSIKTIENFQKAARLGNKKAQGFLINHNRNW